MAPGYYKTFAGVQQFQNWQLVYLVSVQFQSFICSFLACMEKYFFAHSKQLSPQLVDENPFPPVYKFSCPNIQSFDQTKNRKTNIKISY